MRGAVRGRLGLAYKLAVLLYVLAVVILSYREGLSIFAKGAGLLLVGLFLLRAVASREKIFLPTEYKLLFAWFLVGVVSSTISDQPGTALSRVLTLLQVYPITFIISNFIVWNGDSRFYWLCLVLAAAISGVVTLANPVEFSDWDGRIFGTLENANAFAALLAGATAVCFAAMAGERPTIVRAFAGVLAAFFIYLTVRTGSRMGMLATVVAAVTVGVCYQAARKGRGLKRATVIVAVGLALGAGIAYLYTSTEFSKRYAALQEAIEAGDFSATSDTSLYGRARLYQKAFEIFLEEPLVGVGLDVFRTAALEFHTIGNNAHSNYMEVLAGTGIVGAVLYYGIYYVWWRRLLRARSLLRDPRFSTQLMVAFAMAMIILVLDVAWVSYYEKLMLMLLAGLIAESNLMDDARRQGGIR